MTTTVEKSIEVEVPRGTAYKRWRQFVESEGDAHVTEQQPDVRVVWTSDAGVENAGVATFHKLGDDVTRVMLQLEFEPDRIVEEVGDRLGFVSRRADNELKHFKEYIEARGRETGEWRGRFGRE